MAKQAITVEQIGNPQWSPRASAPSRVHKWNYQIVTTVNFLDRAIGDILTKDEIDKLIAIDITVNIRGSK